MEQNMNMGAEMPAEKKPVGSIISIIIIVLVIAFGAYYFLKQVPEGEEAEVLTPAETQADASISSLSTQGTSTDIADIQKDIDTTDISGLDAGLSDITI
ncbi:MAG: hypothetical protein HZB10_00235 [Candidatus Yonathbacteria bacterium]|nr:hypothetical protein [Candidatus Yonathbacteria bacterium]